jgi:hypothetical protein
MLDERGELRDGYAEVGDQRLHYVEAGDGPLIVLLHGFPEFWYGWRRQIQPLLLVRHPGQEFLHRRIGPAHRRALHGRHAAMLTQQHRSPEPPPTGLDLDFYPNPDGTWFSSIMTGRPALYLTGPS